MSTGNFPAPSCLVCFSLCNPEVSFQAPDLADQLLFDEDGEETMEEGTSSQRSREGTASDDTAERRRIFESVAFLVAQNSRNRGLFFLHMFLLYVSIYFQCISCASTCRIGVVSFADNHRVIEKCNFLSSACPEVQF